MSAPARNSITRQPFHSAGAWLLAAALLLAALALGNAGLLRGKAAPQWDAADFFGPQFALAGDQLRAGRLVIWNPWIGGGTPDYAEPELGSTSPVLLAVSFLFTNPQAGYVTYWMLVWAFGGIGMLLLTRSLGCPAWGGAVAALGFVASGFYTGHAEHMSSLYAASFIPWIVWRLDAGLRRRDWWCGVQAGALYGLSALGGYPELTILTPGFLALWALGRALWPNAGRPQPRVGSRLAFASLLLTVAILLGCVILSPAYVPILRDGRGFSDHLGQRARTVAISSNLLPAGALSTLASPYLATLNLPPHPVWPETDVSMTSVYCGSMALLLAAYACRRKHPWRCWLVLTAAFFVVCAFGSQLPVRGWLYDVAIPTRYFRNPAIFRVYAIFIVEVLAALAARDIAEAAAEKADRARLWVLSIVLASSAAVSFAVVLRLAGKETPELTAGIAQFVIVWGGAVILGGLWWKRALALPRFAALVAALALVDAALSLYVSRPTLYTSATTAWWRAMAERRNPDSGHAQSGLRRDLHNAPELGVYPNNRNLPLKKSVFDSYLVFANRFQERLAADSVLSRAAVGPDRLWFSKTADWRAPDDATFARFAERVRNLAGAPVLILHTPEQMLALAPRSSVRPARPDQAPAPALTAPACIPADVSNLSYLADSLSFRYTAPAEGFLLITDRWARNWEATVNGRSRPVLGANFIFRAVRVTPGANDIALRYRPRLFWPLAIVSWCTLILAGAGQAYNWRRRRDPS